MANPKVLVRMVDILLWYIAQGAQFIRLDAIAFLWKEQGTSCIHHENTHRIVQFLRALLEQYAPWVRLITETNVAQTENLSYFGKGQEAHMVYQFPLPPLLLDAYIRQNARVLTSWAQALPNVPEGSLFFNFAASHDGIGLLPSYDFLSEEERKHLIETVKARGGRISYKDTPNGKIPYEMNINYFSAITDPRWPQQKRVDCFLSSQAILLALDGIPGIYYHSLIGSENWQEGVHKTGYNRSINRQKLSFEELETELTHTGSLRSLVVQGWKRLLAARNNAFTPGSGQQIFALHAKVFALLRGNPEDSPVLCLHNVSDVRVELSLASAVPPQYLITRNLLGSPVRCTVQHEIHMEPYEVMWLELRSNLLAQV
ncbi:hypothetical protein LSH36_793g00007 [Paralvinella palmiformis]|uniref:Sucrose phosphorylase n=1 Tax=Paralvinella palmiformis TaxID=53620 RepID=A0AAD9MTX4_9ANNE|nr:hypothetical protein LSH36_793g00007 [Paralvinella palmiformis]